MLVRRKMYYSFLDFFSLAKFLVRGQENIIIDKFRQKLKEYFGRDVVLTSSGREAILLGLKALGLKKGDEIIVPSLTLGELIPLLKNEGYKIVLVDVERETFNLDPKLLTQALSEKTKCVMVTHLFGHSAMIKEIMELKEKYGFYIFEDCAHTMFASYQNRPLGTFGDASILSFEGNKPLPTYGGGALVLKNSEHYIWAASQTVNLKLSKFNILKKYIITVLEEIFLISPLFKPVASILFSEKFKEKFETAYRKGNSAVRKRTLFTSFQANVGLKNFEVFKSKSSNNMTRMNVFLSKLNKEKYQYPKGEIGSISSFYNCVIMAKGGIKTSLLRKKLFAHDFDSGIGSEVIDCCDKYFKGEFNSPVAQEIESHVILLPVHEGATNQQLESLVQVLNEIN